MKKLVDYTNKQIQSLTKFELRALIRQATTKKYPSLEVMKKDELVNLVKSLKK